MGDRGVAETWEFVVILEFADLGGGIRGENSRKNERGKSRWMHFDQISSQHSTFSETAPNPLVHFTFEIFTEIRGGGASGKQTELNKRDPRKTN